MFGSHSRFSVAVVAVVVDVEAKGALYLESGEHVGFDTGCGVLAGTSVHSLRTHQQPGVAKPEPGWSHLNLVC